MALIDLANPRTRAVVGGVVVTALVFVGLALLSDHSVAGALVTGVGVGLLFVVYSVLTSRRGSRSQR